MKLLKIAIFYIIIVGSIVSCSSTPKSTTVSESASEIREMDKHGFHKPIPKAEPLLENEEIKRSIQDEINFSDEDDDKTFSYMIDESVKERSRGVLKKRLQTEKKKYSKRKPSAKSGLTFKNGFSDLDMPSGQVAPSAPIASFDEPLSLSESPPEAAHETATTPKDKFDTYKVILGVDGDMTFPGNKGILNVWIGDPQYEPQYSVGSITDSLSIAAVGIAAKIKAQAPDFIVEALDKDCIEIHPTGSDATFYLTPTKTGTFSIAAKVYLYSTKDCSGSYIPKSAKTLEVIVAVGHKEILHSGFVEILKVTWDKFLEFWGVFIGILFGYILYRVRKYFKDKQGYDNES